MTLHGANQFVTKTCLTTFTYLTTYLQDGRTTVESREKVISNTATEERNTIHITPTPTAGITLTQVRDLNTNAHLLTLNHFQTPKLAIGVFHTTYTYFNTLLDGDLPLVITSRHTVTNTITAPDDYLSLLQPSESVTAVYDTNTYYSTVALTKTIHDLDGRSKVLSTTEVLTQLVVTESLPSQIVATDRPVTATDVVKTYFVTYTYFNTFLENGSTIVRTNVSQSSDVVTERVYLYPKKTQLSVTPQQTTNAVAIETDALRIFATKTYLTTFTYFTTLLRDHSDAAAPETLVHSHTRVVENVVTESLPHHLFPTQTLNALRTAALQYGPDFVTLATPVGGSTALEITAVIETDHKSVEPEISDDNNVIDTEVPEENRPHAAALQAASISAADSGSDQEEDQEHESLNEVADDQVPAASSSFSESNPTKPAADKVNDLIGNFNFNGLTAFGPVFNAMAGLIQNNFAQRQQHQSAASSNISEVATTHFVTTADGNGPPIYIPVGGVAAEGVDTVEHVEEANYNAFVPPAGQWVVNEEDQRHKVQHVIGKPSHEQPLLNGGIPISPGEVITANSDVIIGRPTGIGPRLPYKNVVVANNVPADMKPPPLPIDHEHHDVADSITLQSVHAEQYIGPPPPLTGPTAPERHQLNAIHRFQTKRPSSGKTHSFKPNIIPITKEVDAGKQPPYRSNLPKAVPKIVDEYRGPPPPQQHQQLHQQQYQQSQQQHQHQHQHPQHQPNHLHLQHQQHQKHNQQTSPSFQHQKPTNQLTTSFQSAQTSHPDVPHHHEEIIEIQRIPEVYSTDLPPIHIINYPQPVRSQLPQLPQPLPPQSAFPTATAPYLQIITASSSFAQHIPEVLERNTNDPLLVNIQPSQVAQVIIPHGSTTALIYGGGHTEPHHNGQYFDEPNAYADADHVRIDFVGPATKHQTVQSNHEVSLNANQLIQDVDLGVPPIQFNHHTEHHEVGGTQIGGLNGDHSVDVTAAATGDARGDDDEDEYVDEIVQRNPDSYQQLVSYNIDHEYLAGGQPHQVGNAYNSVVLTNIGQNTGKIGVSSEKSGQNTENSAQITGKPSKTDLIGMGGPSRPNAPVAHGRPNNPSGPPNLYRGNIGPNREPTVYNRQNGHNDHNMHGISTSGSSIPQQHLYFVHGNNKNLRQQLNIELLPPIKPLATPPIDQNMVIEYMQPPPQLQPQQSPFPQQSRLPQQPLSPTFQNAFYGTSVDNVQVEHLQPSSSIANKENVEEKDFDDRVIAEDSDDHDDVNDIEVTVDSHDEDDNANDDGEIVQETNSVSVRPGQLPADVLETTAETTNVPSTATTSTFTKTSASTSASRIHEPNTQTEANDLQLNANDNENFVYSNNINPSAVHQSIPPHITELRPPFRYNYHYQPFGRQPTAKPQPPRTQQSSRTPQPPRSQQPQHISDVDQYVSPPRVRPLPQIPNINRNRTSAQTSPAMVTPATTFFNSQGQTIPPNRQKLPAAVQRPPFTRPVQLFTTQPTTAAPPASTTLKDIEGEEIQLNIGEVTTTRRNPLEAAEPSGTYFNHESGQKDQNILPAIDATEIFDFRESNNPHNLGAIRETEPIIALQLPGSTTRVSAVQYRPVVANLSMDMRPPPPSPSIELLVPPPEPPKHQPQSIEEVMGLSPPPPVIRDRHRDGNTTATTALPATTAKYPQRPYRPNPNRSRYPTISLTEQPPSPPPATISDLQKHEPKRTTENIEGPHRNRGTRPPYRQVTRTTKWPPVQWTSSNPSITRPTESNLPANHKDADAENEESRIRPTPLTNSVDEEESHVTNPTVPQTDTTTTERYAKKDTARHEGQYIRQFSAFNVKQRLPSDILILGSELPLASTPSESVEMTTELPSVIDSTSEVDVSDEKTSTTSTNQPNTARLTSYTQRTRSKAPIDRSTVILPTKYITNTKTLTVTTTKTTVIRSQGITTTLTLTLTKTSTLVDRVTHQVTHTLVQPTRTVTTTTTRTTATTLSSDVRVSTPAFAGDAEATSAVYTVPPYPNYPAFPVQATTTTKGAPSSISPATAIESDDELHLDEFIINYDDTNAIRKVPSASAPSRELIVETNHALHHEPSDSIFVVMTDQKQSIGRIHLHSAVLDPAHINAMSSKPTADIGTDAADSENIIDIDLPGDRDEDDQTKEVNQVLLGGILIATPPRIDASPAAAMPGPNQALASECRPDCKATRNELCQRVDSHMRCVCRPGFARMFPDRPCKRKYL